MFWLHHTRAVLYSPDVKAHLLQNVCCGDTEEQQRQRKMRAGKLFPVAADGKGGRYQSLWLRSLSSCPACFSSAPQGKAQLLAQAAQGEAQVLFLRALNTAWSFDVLPAQDQAMIVVQAKARGMFCHTLIFVGSHGIVWVGRDPRDHRVPIPCHGQDTFHQGSELPPACSSTHPSPSYPPHLHRVSLLHPPLQPMSPGSP